MNKVKLILRNTSVIVDAGEVIGYTVKGVEYLHQKGNPGWRNVDTEMFPIIGPTNESNFRVQTPKGAAIQDQHGLLREMEYELIEKTEFKAVFQKKYKADTLIANSKYPAKSTEEKLSWPYDFVFQKSVELVEDGLQIAFVIAGEEGMPFMLGYHPAFMVKSKTAMIVVDQKTVTIPDVMAVGSRAMPILDTNDIQLVDQKSVRITSDGFKHFMLWTEVSNMVCIEPITFYPYAVSQDNLSNGFMQLGKESKRFMVKIQVL